MTASKRGRGGWLLSLLADVVEAPPGKAPDWVFALVDRFLGVQTPLGLRFPCPCCDYLTIDQPTTETICPVCGWQDDLVQLRDPDYRGGPNGPRSRREARAMFAAHGYYTLKIPTRAPLPEEFPPD